MQDFLFLAGFFSNIKKNWWSKKCLYQLDYQWSDKGDYKLEYTAERKKLMIKEEFIDKKKKYYVFPVALAIE